MTDLTDAQRIERARLAKLAIDEFLDPAFAVVSEEYRNRLTAVCASRPWDANAISALANAERIVTEVRNQIMGLVFDGEEAKRKKSRAETIEQMSPAKRRLLNIGAY